ncbi:MAG: hypothetical protein DVB29_05535 [Verrucomicrobia bacterium]|nr:MAG: hypothetical protein DVB29_05535 [Verrucomicrobiota bacterium]
MDAALDSYFDLDSRDSYSLASQSSARLALISFARRLATNQYKIGGLARIFHTDLLRKPGSQMDAALDSHFDLCSMYTYSPALKCSPALPHQPSQLPRRDQYEISGLVQFLKSMHNKSCVQNR